VDIQLSAEEAERKAAVTKQRRLQLAKLLSTAAANFNESTINDVE